MGIRLPEIEDKMCYAVDSDEVQNGRIGAYYYQPKFRNLSKAVQQAKFQIKTIENLSSKVINGLDFRRFTESGIPYLRVSNIKPNSFDLTEVKYIPEFSISKDIELEIEDLLITRKGTYGVATVVDEKHKNMVISSEIFRIVLKKEGANTCYSIVTVLQRSTLINRS